MTSIDVGTFNQRVGQHLGYSDWYEITQERIAAFADVTEDHGWPHVDDERARASPLGGTIAHGYLTLALFVRLLTEFLSVEGKTLMFNYGINRLRFTTPVPAGARVRLGVEVAAVRPLDDGELVTYGATFELAGSAKPACVAEILFRYYH
jgi:acyl dehydratase